MKVGLLGPYSDVARLLEAPANAVTPQKGSESFENLLASVSPNAPDEARARYAGAGLSPSEPPIRGQWIDRRTQPPPKFNELKFSPLVRLIPANSICPEETIPQNSRFLRLGQKVGRTDGNEKHGESAITCSTERM